MDFEQLDKFLEENGGTSDLLRHIPSNEISLNRIIDLHSRVAEEGSILAIYHYGTLANAVAGCPVPSKSDVMKESVFVIHKSLKALKKELSVYKKDVEKFTPEELLFLRRSLAVHVYLVYKALSGMESKAVQENHNMSMNFGSAKKNRGRGGPKPSEGGSAESWDGRRSMLIEDLLEVLECSVEKIWDDDVASGFSLPRLIIRTMLSHLNETFLAKENLRSGPEAYKILGLIAKQFNKQEEVMTRLIPLVKVSEDVGKLVARAIEVMVSDYELPEVVSMGMSAAAEMCLDLNQKDLNAEKGFASFITELCQLTPAEVLVKCTNNLIEFLDTDSMNVRSAVLSSAAVLLKWLNSENGKGPGRRLLREALIERILLLHTRDTNALARSKALSTLTKLISSDDLEATEAAKCLAQVKPRLMDKAVTVRKNAAQLVIAVLSKFPVIVKTEFNFKEEVDKTRKKVLELLTKKNPKKSHYIYGLVKEFLEQAHNGSVPKPSEDLGPLEKMDDVREIVTNLVTREQYWDACTVLYHVFDKFGKEAGFTDVAERTGVVGIYLGYFNLSAEQDSQSHSDLETSVGLSQSMSQEDRNGKDGYFEPEEVVAEKTKLLYFQGCENMSAMVPEVIGVITAWLDAGSDQDKAEMINLVGVFVQYGYPVNEKVTSCIIKAISQVTNQSAGDLLPAFWSIFIGDRDIGDVALIQKLFVILGSVTVTVKECLRPIIAEMYKAGKITRETIMVLWDAFTKRNEHWGEEDSKYAIFVLGVLGQCDKKIMEQNLDLVIETALGDRGRENMDLVKYALEAIIFTFKKSKKGESDFFTTTRWKSDHVLFEKLLDILVWGMQHVGNEMTDWNYPKVAESSVQIIYRLCTHPADITEKMLKRLTLTVFGDGKEIPVSGIKNTERCHIRYLSFMRSLLGAHINYHESVILPEVRRRKAIKTKSAGSKRQKTRQDQSSLNRTSRRNGLPQENMSRISDVSTLSSRSGSAANQSTAEMDLVIGTVGYDGEQEVIRNFIDKLLDSGAFQQFRILTLHFCKNVARHKSLRLKVVCVQALAKIMSVSAESVTRHMDMFLELWATADSSVVKIEIIKQCTVLSSRFPNQMERSGSIIKNGIISGDNIVKISCLDFITYLALGDLVNVRDHIADVACLLCDVSPKIREMSKDFFNVCAEKGNVISNAVPEVISRLSTKEDLSQKAFQDIMQFLLVRVTKEKQILGLVEKLVARFKGASARNERQWQDTAFCLAKLPHPEKSMKILKDNMSIYIDKLHDDLVFKCFAEICETLRKIGKDDFNAKVEDFEKELLEGRDKCLENKRIEDAANRQKHGKKPKKGEGEDNSKDESSLMEGNVSGDEEEGENEGGEEEEMEVEGLNDAQKSDVEDQETNEQDEEDVKKTKKGSKKGVTIKKEIRDEEGSGNSEDDGIRNSEEQEGSDSAGESDSQDQETDEEDEEEVEKVKKKRGPINKRKTVAKETPKEKAVDKKTPQTKKVAKKVPQKKVVVKKERKSKYADDSSPEEDNDGPGVFTSSDED